MSLSVAASTQSLSAQTVYEQLQDVRLKAPRVHAITNSVAQTFTANVLLALGAVPSMTIAPEEVAAFASSSDALLVNLGTLDDTRKAAIPVAIEAARSAGRPISIDPVFVNRSKVRCSFARALMETGPDLVRLNADEMAALFNDRAEVDNLISAGTVFAVTGEEDKIEGNGEDFRLLNGHPLMGRVTATGCAGGAVLAAFLAVGTDKALSAACGLSVFNIAGEIAASNAAGPGSLVPELLDALYALSLRDIESRLKTA
ncbi:MAG: hydroxyethylthiazole kinase [Roseibium sp.]|uniref:hydroxyethylthiazole kinase n=1 Tax=Roseibium sp. TaxID=1936156 RepID=UPI001AFFF8B7|nr:hydroxyethylthiazole kinase [Roseibium sp.]MBO6508826.1 hydroxyethylthiazole kinase [Roseibium sp.]MBO6893230.1 hydroxyethylthiazole kinase [Roseibium sp.]MBO6932123.1 hydroxyethylthiazole kinase [Roseibium sp.]